MSAFFPVVCHVERNSSLTLRFIQDSIHGVELGHAFIHFDDHFFRQLLGMLVISECVAFNRIIKYYLRILTRVYDFSFPIHNSVDWDPIVEVRANEF